MTRAPDLRPVDNCAQCIHVRGRYCEMTDCDKHENGGEYGYICDDYE